MDRTRQLQRAKEFVSDDELDRLFASKTAGTFCTCLGTALFVGLVCAILSFV